jgi:hypothetical protein
MYMKLTLASLMLAGTLCPIAPANYGEIRISPAAQKAVKAEHATRIGAVTMVTDYIIQDDTDDEDIDQVGGADVVPAVWYHTPEVPLVFSDVSYHHHARHHASGHSGSGTPQTR